MVDFGEVRSALHGEHDEQSWKRLCELCEAADAQEWGEQLGPYVLRSLEAWPDEERKLPARWLRRTMEANAPPACVEMATTLRVELTPKSMTGVFDLRRLEPLLRPALRQLSLSVSGLDAKRYKDRMDVSGLLASPGLSGLRELELGGDLLSEPMLGIVAKNEALRGVSIVGLKDAKLTPRLVSALADAPFVQHATLRVVRITQCEGINKHLAEGGLWDGVTSLQMSDDRYTGDYSAEFASRFPHRELTNLDLSEIRQRGVLEAMLDGELASGLRTLRLNACYSLDPEQVIRCAIRLQLKGLAWTGVAPDEHIARYICEQLITRASAKLEALWLGRVTSKQLPQVLAGGELEALRVLKLEHALDVPDIAALGRARLPRLERLHIWTEQMAESELIEALTSAPWFAQLRHLHLSTYSSHSAQLAEMLAARCGGRVTTRAYWDSPQNKPLWDELGMLS